MFVWLDDLCAKKEDGVQFLTFGLLPFSCRYNGGLGERDGPGGMGGWGDRSLANTAEGLSVMQFFYDIICSQPQITEPL